MATNNQMDVVIVGAGLSGLTAAHKLLQMDPSLKLIILEAKARVGGRTIGCKLKTTTGVDTWDLGGQWVGSCQKEAIELLGELGLETYDQFSDGLKLMQLGSNRVSSYNSEIPPLSFLALIDLHLFMRRIDRMRTEIDQSNPGWSPHAAEWDSITLEAFKQRHLWTKGAQDALDATVRCMFGADPVHISLLYFVTYVACAGGLEPLVSTKRNVGGQEFKVKGGAWQMCTKLVDLLPTGSVKLRAPVSSVTQSSDGSSVTVSTTGGNHYLCRRLILAIPPHQAVKIDFSPLLPLDKLHVFQRMPVGYLTKVVVTYETDFWRKNGLSGEVVTMGGESIIDGCNRGPLSIIFDATSSNGNPALVSFIGGDQQLQYAKLLPEDRRRAVLHSLATFFGPDSLQPVDYCEKNWNDEEYNGGCPVSVGTPGMMTTMTTALRQPFGSIHLAGTESATSWCGFLNGAVQAGKRAAFEALYHLRPEMLSATDLEGTAYGTSRLYPPLSSKQLKTCFFFRFSVGFCIATVATLLVGRFVLRNSRSFDRFVSFR